MDIFGLPTIKGTRAQGNEKMLVSKFAWPGSAILLLKINLRLDISNKEEDYLSRSRDSSGGRIIGARSFKTRLIKTDVIYRADPWIDLRRLLPTAGQRSKSY